MLKNWISSVSKLIPFHQISRLLIFTIIIIQIVHRRQKMNFSTSMFFRLACSFSFISCVYLRNSKREIILLFYFATRPVVVRIISATKLVNLVSLRLDFFYVRVQISILHILFVRDPFFLGQMYFQKVQLRATYEPRNSIILDRRFTHSFVARWPRKYASRIFGWWKGRYRNSSTSCARLT